LKRLCGVKEFVGFEKPSKMPSFRIFSRDDLYVIHWASLDILEKTALE